MMVTHVLALVLTAAPTCTADQVHFSWPASSFPVVRDGVLSIRALEWVSPSEDAFVMELAGGRVLVGKRAGRAQVVNVVGWKREGLELRLPLAQGGVVFTESGAGVGCSVLEKGIDLGGPISANVRIDARKKWTFELRDRSMKQVCSDFRPDLEVFAPSPRPSPLQGRGRRVSR